MRLHLRHLLLPTAALAVLLAACSDGDSNDPQDDEAEETTGLVTEAAPDRPLQVEGPDDGAILGADTAADAEVVVEAVEAADDVDLSDLRILVDDTDVTDETNADGARMVWSLANLDDGDWTISLVSETPGDDTDDAAVDGAQNPDNQDAADDQNPSSGAEPELVHTWQVTVDTTPPEVELTEPDGAVISGEPFTVAGVTEPGATVQIGDDELTADDDGNFSLELPGVPEGEVAMVATDLAGNTSETELAVYAVPSRASEPDNIRTAHVSFCAWNSPTLIDPIMDLVEDGTFNAVQLDLKDETGYVGYDTDVEFASMVGADNPDCRFNLEEAVEQLHELDVPVIGRIVAFADPVLADWAWNNDERDMVMQTEAGEKYTGRYSGFANFANDDVVNYLVDVAEEAASMGVDHILWDYIRTPDGDGARFPGLEGDPQDAIVEFTRLADEAVSPYGAQHGASVYGVSADRPAEVGQNIEAMAEHLDYMAPMIYPSHWGPGEYDVADPLNQPYDIIAATLEVWLEVTEGTRARIFPWLEDSNYPASIGGPDRTTYLREQLQASYDAGVHEWMLWDSAVNYTTDAVFLPDPGDEELEQVDDEDADAGQDSDANGGAENEATDDGADDDGNGNDAGQDANDAADDSQDDQ